MRSEIFHLIKKDPHTWSLANLLSLSRLLFLPLICWAITLQTRMGNVLALVFLALSGATDFFDGYLARKLDQRSFLGRILDPLLDKITVGVTLLFLAAYRQLPYWYVFLVIARDVLILTAAASLVKHIKAVAESNYLGKWTLGSFLIVIMTYTINWSPYQRIALWISSLLVPATLFSYLKKFWELLRTDHT